MKDYGHVSFDGAEPNDHLQKMVLQAFNGELESDERWTRYVELRLE